MQRELYFWFLAPPVIHLRSNVFLKMVTDSIILLFNEHKPQPTSLGQNVHLTTDDQLSHPAGHQLTLSAAVTADVPNHTQSVNSPCLQLSRPMFLVTQSVNSPCLQLSRPMFLITHRASTHLVCSCHGRCS